MYILALESSTTSAKAMLYDTSNGSFEVKSEPYRLETCDVTTHNAQKVLEQTAQIGKELCEGRRIDIIALSGTWHSLMLCNKDMEPETPVYLWSYTGAAGVCKELRNDTQFVNSFYNKTGCMVNAIYPAFKIKLLERNGYKLSDYLFAGQGTYNNYRLTGERVVTDSVASGTGLLNIHNKDWDDEILKEIGISREQLPRLIKYDEMLKLNSDGARLLGLPEGTPVLATQPDGGLNQVGAGALGKGVMSFSVGTSGAIRLSTDRPIIPEKPSTWCYLSPKRWLSGAATSGCCNCLDWYKVNFFPSGASYSDMEEGCGDINNVPVFLPFIYGERCPGWEDERNGNFFDIKPAHTVYDMYRAVQEGALFNLYQCYQVLTELNGAPEKIKLSGGILKSRLWTQMCADIFGADMQVDKAEHSSLLGGVAMAMEAIGEIDDASHFECESGVVIKPNPAMAEVYSSKFQRYMYWYNKTM